MEKELGKVLKFLKPGLTLGGGEGDRIRPLLARWPVPLPADWEKRVNRPETR